MVLTGHIDERNQLWVDIVVGGTTQKQTITALIDTGFTGELVLPLQIAIALGLKLTAATKMTYANGVTSEEMVFTGSLYWGTKSRLVTISVLNSGVPLIGGGLLHGYVLLVDFEKKTLTIKEPGVDEPSPSVSPSATTSPSATASPSPSESKPIKQSEKGTK